MSREPGQSVPEGPGKAWLGIAGSGHNPLSQGYTGAGGALSKDKGHRQETLKSGSRAKWTEAEAEMSISGLGEGDRAALVALHNATGGPNWDSNDNWLSDVPISEWSGVTIDDNGRVTGLNLRRNQLSGKIPPELGNLENLTRLDLRQNQLSGEIPPWLDNLANLQELSLRDNQLSGEIPSELGNLANLVSLFLGGNQLIGSVPNSLSGRLVYSDLGGLQFCPLGPGSPGLSPR